MASRDVEFVRLVDGRLWHLPAPDSSTLCGVAVRVSGDKVPEVAAAAPRGAWICERCVVEATHWAEVARRALLADPRRTSVGDLLIEEQGSEG